MRQYTQGLRGSKKYSIASSAPISKQELQERVPAIFAEQPYATCSEKYRFVSTWQFLEALAEEGFFPYKAAQATPKAEDRLGYAKHIINLRRSDMIGQREAQELIFVGSADKTSGTVLLGGVFSFSCANGLCVGSMIQEQRFTHLGHNDTDRVIEGAYTVLNQFDEVGQYIDEWKGTRLTGAEQEAYATSALALRYGTEEEREGKPYPIQPYQILRAKRSEDMTPTLWNTFNKVQEHLVKGGVKGISTSDTGQRRRSTTRPVNSISDNVRLNRALWDLTTKMAELKVTH